MASDNNSFILGTPLVTAPLAEIPEWWNVFKVICVAGSPIHWAHKGPTISPAGIKAFENLK